MEQELFAVVSKQASYQQERLPRNLGENAVMKTHLHILAEFGLSFMPFNGTRSS